MQTNLFSQQRDPSACGTMTYILYEPKPDLGKMFNT